MTDETTAFVEALRRVIDEMPYADNEPSLRSYSGRFMYGGRCVAVAVDNMAEVAMLLYCLGQRDTDGRFEEMVDSATFDDMGLGKVVYFTRAKLDDADRLPGDDPVEVEEDDEEDDDGDPDE